LYQIKHDAIETFGGGGDVALRITNFGDRWKIATILLGEWAGWVPEPGLGAVIVGKKSASKKSPTSAGYETPLFLVVQFVA
jgi:hypothetical protein